MSEMLSINEIAKGGLFTDGDWIELPHISDRGIRLIQTGNIGVGKFINKNKNYIYEDSFTKLNCKEVLPGDILICRLAEPPGRACIAPNLGEKMITSVDVAILRLSNNAISKEFLTYYLNLPEQLNAVDILSAGSTRKRISRKNLGAMKLLIPDFSIQIKISQILKSLDEKIEATEGLIEKKKSIKRGLVQDLISTKKYDKSLEDVVDILDNLRIPVNDEERQRRGGDVPYYGANGLQGFIDKPLFNEPLILIAEDGGNFEQFSERPIAYRISGPSWVNNHAHILRAKNYNQDYLFYVLEHMNILSLISGGTRAKLNQGELKKIKVPSIGINEQKPVADLINLIVDEINSILILKDKLITQKQGLMQDLISGRVSVN